MTGFYNIIEIQWPPKDMADVVKRASKSAAAKRKRNETTETSSDDSDTLQAAIDEAKRRKEEKRALKASMAEGESIKKRLDEQCAINARRLKERKNGQMKPRVLRYRVQPCRWPRTYDRIQHSNRPDFKRNNGKRKVNESIRIKFE
jgi:hypothetical protein